MKQKDSSLKQSTVIEICMRFGGESVFFDPTNPAARRYVWDKCPVKTIMIKVSAYSGWMKQSLNILAMIMTTIATILTRYQIGKVYPQYFSRYLL